METLLQGYDEQDEDQVFRVCNSPLLKYMDNDVSSLGLQLNVRLALLVRSGSFKSHLLLFKWSITFLCATDPMKLQNVASGHVKR